MSCDVKAAGTLTFDSKDDLEDAMAHLDEDEDDPSLAEVREIVARGTTRKGKKLTFAIDANLTAEANVWFQEWLGDVAEEAAGGHLDTWQEDLGDASFMRIHAGGEEEEVAGAFPAPVAKPS